jgi:hypothetical protein
MMTPEIQSEMLHGTDALRRTVQQAYRNAAGAEEFALAVVLQKLAEIERIIQRCA